MDDKPIGIECPKCGCRHLYVTHTRQLLRKIRRYRECRHCGHKFPTIEKISDIAFPQRMEIQT